jgi:hypothetical protein
MVYGDVATTFDRPDYLYTNCFARYADFTAAR